jgi:hypothetical protein
VLAREAQFALPKTSAFRKCSGQGFGVVRVHRVQDAKRLVAPVRGRRKAFELEALFVRCYVSLDVSVHGHRAAARAWLDAPLQGRPVDLLKSVRGLVAVVQYLDHRRDRL